MSTAQARPRLQRTSGAVHIGTCRRGSDTALHTLSQSGCLRACFPRQHGPALEAVIVNTAGGTTDGDSLQLTAEAAAHTDFTIATPSAECIYGAMPNATPACITIALHAHAGARLEYLPQETILFDASALHRTLRIDLAADATYLGLDALIFGRPAHGEALQTAILRDTIIVRRDGRLVLHDAIRLHGPVAALLRRRASARGCSAVATLVYAAPDSAAGLEAVRCDLQAGPAEHGASVWNGVLVIRLLARDGLALRESARIALAALRPGRRLPRVWSA